MFPHRTCGIVVQLHARSNRICVACDLAALSVGLAKTNHACESLVLCRIYRACFLSNDGWLESTRAPLENLRLRFMLTWFSCLVKCVVSRCYFRQREVKFVLVQEKIWLTMITNMSSREGQGEEEKRKSARAANVQVLPKKDTSSIRPKRYIMGNLGNSTLQSSAENLHVFS